MFTLDLSGPSHLKIFLAHDQMSKLVFLLVLTFLYSTVCCSLFTLASLLRASSSVWFVTHRHTEEVERSGVSVRRSFSRRVECVFVWDLSCVLCNPKSKA